MISRNSSFYRSFAGLGIAALAAVTLSACGADDKPAFCADRSSFEDSVNEIPSLVTSGDLSKLKSQIETVQTDAGTLADSARSDYPEETDAIESSVNSLRTTIDGLPQNPKPAELAGLGLQAATAISAVKDFTSATKSDCE